MSDELPCCPKCEAQNFKVWKLPNPLLLHWVLNPGLAFNELVLGQRLPRLSIECLSCNLPRDERSFVFCPACHTLHDARIWQGKQGFRNWLGLVCPTCGERIPCLWNLFSLAILAVTAPLWIVPVYFYRKRANSTRPTLTHLTAPRPAPKQVFLRLALFWGGFMFIAMTLVPEIRKATATGEWDWAALAIGAIIWTVGGIAFGWVMTKFLRKRPDNAERSQTGP